jgi:hypothetical protein
MCWLQRNCWTLRPKIGRLFLVQVGAAEAVISQIRRPGHFPLALTSGPQNKRHTGAAFPVVNPKTKQPRERRPELLRGIVMKSDHHPTRNGNSGQPTVQPGSVHPGRLFDFSFAVPLAWWRQMSQPSNVAAREPPHPISLHALAILRRETGGGPKGGYY